MRVLVSSSLHRPTLRLGPPLLFFFPPSEVPLTPWSSGVPSRGATMPGATAISIFTWTHSISNSLGVTCQCIFIPLRGGHHLGVIAAASSCTLWRQLGCTVCTKVIDCVFNGDWPSAMLNATCHSSPHLVLPEGYPSRQGDLHRPQPGPHLLPAPLRLPAMPGAAHLRISK